MFIPTQKQIIASKLYQEAKALKKKNSDNESLLPFADWLLDYVKGKLAHYTDNMSVLEDKADNIIKYLGLVITAMTAIIGWFQGEIGDWFFKGMLSGSIFLFLALASSLATKMPIKHPSSPSLKVMTPKLLKYSTLSQVNLDLAFILNESVIGSREIIKWKSGLLKWSFSFLTLGLILIMAGGIAQLKSNRFHTISDQSPLSSQSTSSSSSSGSGGLVLPQNDLLPLDSNKK